uniref:Uncharacterized protein n=1 Tax=Anopheles culicifacies TaxID=139723 RepID=A0A182ML66_9DIPT
MAAALRDRSISSPESVPNHHTYVQYVDSEMYNTTGQGQSQMTYPVYSVGDYGTIGQQQQQQQQQQYYTTGGSYGTAVTGTGNTHTDSTGAANGAANGSGTPGNGPNSVNANGTVPSGNGGSAGGNANQQQYIVPVDEAVLLSSGSASGTQQQQSDSSPQNMTKIVPIVSFIEADMAHVPAEVPAVNHGMMLMERTRTMHTHE